MSFFQDLGSFFEEAKQFGDELDTIKQDVFSSVVNAANEVKDTSSDIGANISESANSVKQSTSDIANDISKSLPKKD